MKKIRINSRIRLALRVMAGADKIDFNDVEVVRCGFFSVEQKAMSEATSWMVDGAGNLAIVWEAEPQTFTGAYAVHVLFAYDGQEFAVDAPAFVLVRTTAEAGDLTEVEVKAAFPNYDTTTAVVEGVDSSVINVVIEKAVRDELTKHFPIKAEDIDAGAVRADAIAADSVGSSKLSPEVRSQLEDLKDDIDEETARASLEEKSLDTKISSETARAQSAESALSTSKLDKVSTPSATVEVYAKGTDGAQTMLASSSSSPAAGSLVRRNASGQSQIATPTERPHIANKAYVDDAVSAEKTRAEQAEQALASSKQDNIEDLEAIRSGAAKGETALQGVPETYRTAEEQDAIDDTKASVDYVDGAIENLPTFDGDHKGLVAPRSPKSATLVLSSAGTWENRDIVRQQVTNEDKDLRLMLTYHPGSDDSTITKYGLATYNPSTDTITASNFKMKSGMDTDKMSTFLTALFRVTKTAYIRLETDGTPITYQLEKNGPTLTSEEGQTVIEYAGKINNITSITPTTAILGVYVKGSPESLYKFSFPNMLYFDGSDGVDTSTAQMSTSFADLFASASSLKRVDLGADFRWNKNGAPGWMFNGTRALEYINLGDYFDTQYAVNLNLMFNYCTALTTIVGRWVNLMWSIDFRSSPLTHDSAMVIINGLYDYVTNPRGVDVSETAQVLTLYPTTKNALSQEEKAMITAKGWTLA